MRPYRVSRHSARPPGSAIEGQNGTVTSRSGRAHDYRLAASDEAVELWTTQRLPFETEQSASEKTMVSEVGAALRELSLPEDRILAGSFISDDTTGTQPDAENICFYNFRAASGFQGARTDLRFERSYDRAPQAPDGLDAPYFHCWRGVPPEAPLVHWRAASKEPFASWSQVHCTVVEGEKAGRHIWLAMRREAAACQANPGTATEATHFVIDLALEVPFNEASDRSRLSRDVWTAQSRASSDSRPSNRSEHSGQPGTSPRGRSGSPLSMRKSYSHRWLFRM